MPRPLRYIFADQCYHVLNRANHGAQIFHEPADYWGFLKLIQKAQARVHLPILAACLMPNHFHFVVRPTACDAIARWMQWLLTTHARHYHEKYSTFGRLWQGRYKALLVQSDHYLLAVMRYVERNALRKNLVARAEDWDWGSLKWRINGKSLVELEPSPIALPNTWNEWVNQPQTAAELEAIRNSVNKQRPFGDPEWVEQKAKESGLSQSLVDVGRPRKIRSDPNC